MKITCVALYWLNSVLRCIKKRKKTFVCSTSVCLLFSFWVSMLLWLMVICLCEIVDTVELVRRNTSVLNLCLQLCCKLSVPLHHKHPIILMFTFYKTGTHLGLIQRDGFPRRVPLFGEVVIVLGNCLLGVFWFTSVEASSTAWLTVV